jgi:ATP-dependent RNA helicase DDX5/DBP2
LVCLYLFSDEDAWACENRIVSLTLNDFVAITIYRVHRVGRTGRAGKKGAAISFFVAEKNGRMARDLVDILKRTDQNIPPELMSLASFASRGGGR